jgi:hypothetical protein
LIGMALLDFRARHFELLQWRLKHAMEKRVVGALVA